MMIFRGGRMLRDDPRARRVLHPNKHEREMHGG